MAEDTSITVENPIAEFSLYISKPSMKDGIRKWSAVNSDTDWDIYGEKMSPELYSKMIGYIKEDAPPPIFKEEVCSDYWCGGNPYLSLAHYPDLNGKAVPGEVTDLWVDGKQLKARGYLFNNKLGEEVWKSLKEDETKPKNSDRIRISIAFLDLAHKHGESGQIFERKSVTDFCSECRAKVGNKIYVDGYLIHLALTRVPVNPRTLMIAEKSMAKKTRKEDAESIVKDSSVIEEIDTLAAIENKSDVLVEMSDTEPETENDVPVVEESSAPKDKKEKKEDSEEEEDDKKEKKYPAKSLTAEDVAEIVKSVMAQAGPVEVLPVQEKSALDVSVDNLYTSINSAIALNAPVEEKLQSINPALADVGSAIAALVKDSTTQESKVGGSDSSVILEAIHNLSTEFKGEMDGVKQEIAILKEKSNTVGPVTPRVPAPRSLVIPSKSLTQNQTEEKPGSVRSIVRRSVGIQS